MLGIVCRILPPFMCTTCVWHGSFRYSTGKEEQHVYSYGEGTCKIRKEVKEGKAVTLRFQSGTYHFYPEGAAERTYYISNHDQDNPKRVGLALEDMKSLTIEGNGAEFIFHGQMIPVSLLRSTDCTLQNFSIDFANPHIAQVEIIKMKEKKESPFNPLHG